MAAKKLFTNDVKKAANSASDATCKALMYHGNCMDLLKSLPDESIDLTVTSPPYCMGKEYEEGNDLATFLKAHEKIFPEIVRITKPGGSICWQVGSHVSGGSITPLDYLVHQLLSKEDGIYLRNRVIWTFGHGFHCTNRFSGRYEVVMWYTKGEDYYFDLDAVRVPQKYPGKRANKGPKKGELSGNPRGKNPSDIWEDLPDDIWHIPNVKANHIEKTEHPCQYPVALVTRLVRALSPASGLVLDPFAGVASAGVSALLENRRFLGAELNREYINIANKRLCDAISGEIKIRPLEKEIYAPQPNEKVAMKPDHFWKEQQKGITL